MDLIHTNLQVIITVFVSKRFDSYRIAIYQNYMFQNIHKLALFLIPFNSNLKLWIGIIEGFRINPHAHFHFPLPPAKTCPIFDLLSLQKFLTASSLIWRLYSSNINILLCFTFHINFKVRSVFKNIQLKESFKDFTTKPRNPKLRIEIIIGKVRTRVPNKNEIHFNDYYARKRFPWTLLCYSTDER